MTPKAGEIGPTMAGKRITSAASNGSTAVVITSSASANDAYVTGATVTETTGTQSTPANDVSTTLAVSATGLQSNADASVSAQGGQDLTVGVGSLTNPTLKTPVVASQFVIGPSTGSTVGSFNFKSSVGTSVISELGFKVTGIQNGITSITVGGVTKTVAGANATTTVTGLNIPVANNNSGVDVPVQVTYHQVGGNGGIASGNSAQLVITSAKFQSGNSTQTNYFTIPASAMTLVAGYPSISVSSPSNVTLTSGNSQLANVTVAVTGGKITLNNLGITTSGVNAVLVNGGHYSLTDANGTEVASSTAVAALGTASLSFQSNYNISGTNVYTLYWIGTETLSGTNAGGSTIYTSLGATNTLSWSDFDGTPSGASPVAETASLLTQSSYNTNVTASVSK